MFVGIKAFLYTNDKNKSQSLDSLYVRLGDMVGRQIFKYLKSIFNVSIIFIRSNLICPSKIDIQYFRILGFHNNDIIFRNYSSAAPSYEYIKTEKTGTDGRVCLIQLNRPKARNILHISDDESQIVTFCTVLYLYFITFQNSINKKYSIVRMV